jgi:5-methylcytosine-specific restriction endonuclease McrA
MSSYIVDNLPELKDRHYIRTATSHNYWFDFAKNKLRIYQQQFGDSFCLIVNGSTNINNAYVMPFDEVKELFKETDLDPDGCGWSGTIINNVLRVRGRSISASAYYNAFDLLEEENVSKDVSFEPVILQGILDSIDLPDIAEVIRSFNEQYRNVSPQKRIVVSERIARPGTLTDYVKAFRNFTCQICHQVVFEQGNGTRYIEAHHIIELHNLLPNSYCSDNIVIVCPTCHKKLHYANVEYTYKIDGKVIVNINSETFEFERNVIS